MITKKIIESKNLGKIGVQLIIAITLTTLIGCAGTSGSGDGPSSAAESATPAGMYDGTTPMGQKIQSNGYDYTPQELDDAFNEAMSCLGLSEIPADLYIELKQPYSAFPCVPLPNGCGGLFDLDNGEPVITVTADMVRLKHEYIHYMLYYSSGDPDSHHETANFDNCA